MKNPHKLLMIILDGWGIGPKNKHNAIWRAKTPTMDRLWKEYPHSTLSASGPAVGLLNRQIGSSEVGHMNIGAGRVVEQELSRLQRSLKDKSFYKNPVLINALEQAKKNNGRLHLVGLVSPGGVHAHQDHLVALLTLAKQLGCKEVLVHALLDGRDTPPASAERYLLHIQKIMKRLHVGTIATLCGRFWAMDRDENWHYTDRAVDLLVNAKGHAFRSMKKALGDHYRRKVYDEFVEPTVLDPNGTIRSNDSVIFFNFRADRMRQLVDRISKKVRRIYITTMIPYGVMRHNVHVAFDRVMPTHHLCQIISEHKLKQLKIAESQKYPHLTYFFNGTREKPYPQEQRMLIPSEDVKSYDLLPEMSAHAISQAAEKALGKFPIVFINFANADMVGHSGNIAAAIQACQFLDTMIGQIVTTAQKNHYDIIITADHGNAEQMYDPTAKSRHTAHTTNPVPFILVTEKSISLKSRGALTNIAPLALELLDLPKPNEMGPSLQI